MNSERNGNESYVAYVKRIVQMVRDGRINYLEMGDCLLGYENCYSSENLRKTFYVLDKMVDKLDGDITITDNELLKEIERQKDELFKETVRLRDKKREISKDLYSISRFENLKRVLIEELAIHRPVECYKRIDYIPRNSEAALLLSDIHYGIKIDNQFNYYDCEVAKDRLKQVVEKTIGYCKLHKVKTLNVELLGDLVSGIINVSNRVEQEEDIITQVVEVGNVLVSVIKTLNEAIPNVNVYTVFGNHSRVTEDKKKNVNRENLERLIYHYIKSMLPDVKVITSLNDDFLCYKIGDKNIVLTHGDKDNVSNAPLNFANILGYVPNEIHMGHYHSFSIKDSNDTEICVNGSLVGTDDYAVSIRKSTKPSQTLRIYGDDICTYKIGVN